MRKPERLASPRPPAGPQPLARLGQSLPIDVPAPDPLAGRSFSEDLEAASVEQLDAIQEGFRARAKAEADRFKSQTGTGYYFTIVFQSEEQASAFLAGVGLANNERFVDGLELAAALAVDLPRADPLRGVPRIDPKLSRLVRKPSRDS